MYVLRDDIDNYGVSDNSQILKVNIQDLVYEYILSIIDLLIYRAMFLNFFVEIFLHVCVALELSESVCT